METERSGFWTSKKARKREARWEGPPRPRKGDKRLLLWDFYESIRIRQFSGPENAFFAVGRKLCCRKSYFGPILYFSGTQNEEKTCRKKAAFVCTLLLLLAMQPFLPVSDARPRFCPSSLGWPLLLHVLCTKESNNNNGQDGNRDPRVT